MIDQLTFEHLVPLAYEWARAQEEFILTRGSPLGARPTADALDVGVQDPDRVRVLVIDRIPLPADSALAEASRRANIITETSRGIAIGHGIIIRANCWGDRELLVHQLVHVAQCEQSGGLESFVRHYLDDRHNSASFTVGSLEEEARRIAREICSTRAAAL